VTTIADHLDAFLADVQRATRPNTLRAYRADLTLAACHLPQPLDQVTAQAAEQWLWLGQPSAATVTRRAVSLRRFFTWAIQQGLCRTNPLAHRVPQPASRRLPRPIRSAADLAVIDREIAALPQPYRLIFTLLRETGMRIGEVLALNKDDVTLTPGCEGLRIREPKNGNERIALLGPDSTPKSLRGLRAWLRQMDGHPGFAPLFCSNRGTRVSYATAQYQWAQLCTRTRLVEGDGRLRYTIHQLRHTRGSELVRQGQRMEIVQRVLGHRDIRSTQGYAELDDVQVREALEHGARQR
jgi:integrase/recombinase XerD